MALSGIVGVSVCSQDCERLLFPINICFGGFMSDAEGHQEDDDAVINSSGEIVKKKISNRGIQWFGGLRKGFVALSDMELKVSDFRLLCRMLGNIKYKSEVVVNQSDYAEKLKLSRETVNRSLNQLEALGVISKISAIGSVNIYKVHPAYCWVGGKGGFK